MASVKGDWKELIQKGRKIDKFKVTDLWEFVNFYVSNHLAQKSILLKSSLSAIFLLT